MKLFSVVNLSEESPQADAVVTSADEAVLKVKQLFALGADFIDIGGRSSYSKSLMIDDITEQRRLYPFFELTKQQAIRQLSLDTWSIQTALMYMDHIDVLNYTSTEFPQSLLTALAHSKVKIIINYLSASNPYTLRTTPCQDFNIDLVVAYFEKTIKLLNKNGVGILAIDPNLGMWHPLVPNAQKAVIQKQIIDHIPLLKTLAPVFIVAPRTAGSLNSELTQQIISKGADFIRTHDLVQLQRLIENGFNR